MWVLNHAQAILTSNSLWILFRETQASVRSFNTKVKTFNASISMFTRKILVKTWKQKFFSNKVNILVCKNVINTYRITKIRILRLDIRASVGRAYLQRFLLCPSPQGMWWRNLQIYTFCISTGLENLILYSRQHKCNRYYFWISFDPLHFGK
jgi:hypothetical protein